MGFFSKLFGGKDQSETFTEPVQARTVTVNMEPYGGVPFLTAPKLDGPFKLEAAMRPHQINDMFEASLPTDWHPFESDRFRAKTEDEQTMISITMFSAPDAEKFDYNDFFRGIQTDTYERFVTEGGYEAYDDLLVGEDFIAQSFKVDEETQYYLTTVIPLDNAMYMANIIIRNLGDYNIQLRAILQAIRLSIEPV